MKKNEYTFEASTNVKANAIEVVAKLYAFRTSRTLNTITIEATKSQYLKICDLCQITGDKKQLRTNS